VALELSPLLPYTTLFRSPRRSPPPAGKPQPHRGHQQQAVGAQALDPEAARPVPDGVQQGDVAVKAALFHVEPEGDEAHQAPQALDRKSTRLNSSHVSISY